MTRFLYNAYMHSEKGLHRHSSVRHVIPNLPPIGAKLINKFGIEFVVAQHVPVPRMESMARLRANGRPGAEDIYPVIQPQNLSRRLEGFAEQIGRCTPKQLMMLDTTPELRRDLSALNHHYINSIGHPDVILMFTDAARVHESILAHELAHLWIEYVELAEDNRVFRAIDDVPRMNQLCFIQSFVLDQWVNELIGEKGFNVELIRTHEAEAVASLGNALRSGYTPPNSREGIFMCMILAAEMLNHLMGRTVNANALKEAIEVAPHDIRHATFALAETVLHHGYRSRDQVRASIDECLRIGFEFSGDPIDFKSELIVPDPGQPATDHRPDWFQGCTSKFKDEVGRLMAKEDIAPLSQWALRFGDLGSIEVTFTYKGISRGPYLLKEKIRKSAHIATIEHVMELNRRNQERQRKMFSNAISSSLQGPRSAPWAPSMPNNSGRRNYMAGLGLFTSRVREAEWYSGEPPYAYAMGNPINHLDSTGLAPCPGDWPKPHECSTWPGGPCRYAEQKRIPQGTLGGLVCCDGVMHACVFNTPKDWPIGIYNCLKKHERDHIAWREANLGFQCGENGFYVPGGLTPKQLKETECRAHRLSLNCFIKGQKDCAKLPAARRKKCFDDYCIVIKDSCFALRLRYDCGGVLPSECGVCDWSFR